MDSAKLSVALAALFSELADGAHDGGGAFVLNSGDAGMLESLRSLSPEEASQSVDDGATIAAHAKHVAYGLSLMNRWAREGGNPFLEARWDEAWKTRSVGAAEWDAIRTDLSDQCQRWLESLSTPRDAHMIELKGMIGSIAHLAYHLGAMRQIARGARGPKEPSRT